MKGVGAVTATRKRTSTGTENTDDLDFEATRASDCRRVRLLLGATELVYLS